MATETPTADLVDAVIDELRAKLQAKNLVRVERRDIDSIGPGEIQVSHVASSNSFATTNGPGPTRAQIDLLVRIEDPRSDREAIKTLDRAITVLTRFEPIPQWGRLASLGTRFQRYEGGLALYIASFEAWVPQGYPLGEPDPPLPSPS